MTSLVGAIETNDPLVVGRTLEVRGRRKDGTWLPLELSLARVEGPAGDELVGSLRDLSERNRMRAMLMQTEKLASIGLLSAGVAHEINNPLAFVTNNLAVLERDFVGVVELVAAYEKATAEGVSEAGTAELEHAGEIASDLDWPYVRDNVGSLVARTREGVQRVADIVANMRGLARTSPTRLEPASLSDLLDTALEIVTPRLKRSSIEVETERPELPKISVVSPQIGQVMLNLLMNALQAVESAHPRGGGRIVARVGRDLGAPVYRDQGQRGRDRGGGYATIVRPVFHDQAGR